METRDPSWTLHKRITFCSNCGKPTSYIFLGKCHNCIEVETRLENYLESEAGKQFALTALEKAWGTHGL